MKKLSGLSIFFPCLNDGGSLTTLVHKAYKVGRQVSDDFEVIIIENGSTDDTPEILKNLQKQHPALRVIWFKKQLGYGGALKQGFIHATKDWVFYTDGDGQYDPLELPRLIHALTPDITVVNGYKLSRSDNFVRRMAGSLYNGLLHLAYPLPIRDVDCDFRLIRRSLFNHIRLTSTSAVICVELVLSLKNAGAQFTEVGISHYPRRHGKSQFFQLLQLLKTLKEHMHFVSLQKKLRSVY